MQPIDIEAARSRIAEARKLAQVHGLAWLDALASDAESLLASHLAMQQAGETMPSVDSVASRLHSAGGGEVSDWHASLLASEAVDEIRPHFARLTQERDEARAEAARLREERAVVDNIYQDEREERAMHQAHAHNVEEERDALRARIAELESRPEPGADVVERVADLLASMADFSPAARERTARAVVSRFAAMGEEAWPTDLDMARVCTDKPFYYVHAPNIRNLFRSRLSPVVGALRARVADLEAAQAAAKPLTDGAKVYVVRVSEPQPDDDPEGVAASFATSALDK